MSDDQVPDISAFASPPRRSLEYQDIPEGDPIGSGGQAMVSSVELTDQTPPTQVAIKEPLADSQTIDTDDIQAFLDEADTWKTVDRREREKPRWKEYEHIVGVVDTGETIPWIAMEYMDGGSLADRLETNPNGLPIDEALWIGECVCRGVEIAHNYGIAHLDLKPANVLFSETPGDVWDVPKVADWGLARVLAEQTGTMEALSIQYAAPEQFDPDEFGDPDTLTDVYQVGALVYAMITGEPPYTGSQPNVMRQVLSKDPPVAPGDVRNDLPVGVDELVSLAIEPEKADRCRSIETLEQALNAIRTGTQLPPQVAALIDSSEGGTANSDTQAAPVEADDTSPDSADTTTETNQTNTPTQTGDDSRTAENSPQSEQEGGSYSESAVKPGEITKKKKTSKLGEVCPTCGSENSIWKGSTTNTDPLLFCESCETKWSKRGLIFKKWKIIGEATKKSASEWKNTGPND